MSATTYIVLRHIDQDDTWRYDGEVNATDANTAIRMAANTAGTPAGKYVAVPARSWKPVNVTSVQQTVLKIGAVDEPA